MANHIIAVGSVDGILTTAAVLAHLDDAEAKVSFTQAFTVHTVAVESGDELWLVDLAVNNSPVRQAIPELGLEAGVSGSDYTMAVVFSWLKAGAVIKAVVDEHNAALWVEVLGRAINTLMVKPMTQGVDEGIFSAGDVFMHQVVGVPSWVAQLCHLASEADQGRFSGVAKIVNKAVKAAIQDNARREACARHLAFNDEPSAQMLEWAAEYEELQRNADEIIANAIDHGSWVFVDTRGKKVDMTSLATSLYKAFPDAAVVVAKGQAYNKEVGGVIPVHSFMASTSAPKEMDLQAVIGLGGFGFAKKWSVMDEVVVEAMAKMAEYLG